MLYACKKIEVKKREAFPEVCTKEESTHEWINKQYVWYDFVAQSLLVWCLLPISILGNKVYILCKSKQNVQKRQIQTVNRLALRRCYGPNKIGLWCDFSFYPTFIPVDP